MRRFSVGLVLVVALMLMLTAIAASAVPDGFCDDGRVHPQCATTTTSDTTTTTTTTVPEIEACPTGTFPIPPKPGQVDFECLWTPENPGTAPLLGTVKVAPLDGISSLLVFVRDDSPGDICLLAQDAENQTESDGSFVGSFDLAYGTMDEIVEGAGWDPQDYPEAPSFEPYVDQTYWTVGGTHWCYPQDGNAGMRQDLNGEPLHLWIRFRANPKATSEVWVTLTPAQEAGS